MPPPATTAGQLGAPGAVDRPCWTWRGGASCEGSGEGEKGRGRCLCCGGDGRNATKGQQHDNTATKASTRYAIRLTHATLLYSEIAAHAGQKTPRGMALPEE